MPINFENTKIADARTVRLSIDVVATVTPDDLARKTPCTEWNLGDLLAHLVAQHRGFAAAARGHGDDPAVWKPAPLTDLTTYRAAAEDVLAAFGTVSDPGQPFRVPEIAADRPIPAVFAVSAHAVDYLVHSWDVAAALGRPFTPDEDLAVALLPIAQLVPDGEQRSAPGSQFAPGLPPAEGTSPFEQLLRTLGRDPQWVG